MNQLTQQQLTDIALAYYFNGDKAKLDSIEIIDGRVFVTLPDVGDFEFCPDKKAEQSEMLQLWIIDNGWMIGKDDSGYCSFRKTEKPQAESYESYKDALLATAYKVANSRVVFRNCVSYNTRPIGIVI